MGFDTTFNYQQVIEAIFFSAAACASPETRATTMKTTLRVVFDQYWNGGDDEKYMIIREYEKWSGLTYNYDAPD